MASLDESVQSYLDGITNPTRRQDATTLLEVVGRITGEPARMWGSIIGFGSYHYKYASGREGDAPAAGFAARKVATTIYLPDGIGAHLEKLRQLGEHKIGVGCLSVKDLAAIDLGVLESIIDESFRTVKAGI